MWPRWPDRFVAIFCAEVRADCAREIRRLWIMVFIVLSVVDLAETPWRAA